MLTNMSPLCFQANLLLLHNSLPTVLNHEYKTSFDLACEFGRYRVSLTNLFFLVFFSIVFILIHKTLAVCQKNVPVCYCSVIYFSIIQREITQIMQILFDDL